MPLRGPVACRTVACTAAITTRDCPAVHGSVTGDELVGEQTVRPSAADELVEFDGRASRPTSPDRHRRARWWRWR